MKKRLSKLLQKWALQDQGDGDEVFLDQSAVEYLGRKVFNDYEPSQFDQFEDRLDRWLHNVTGEKEQQTLFLLLSRLFFIGRPEFESLYRAAYNGQVFRWLVEQLHIDIADPTAVEVLEVSVAETWFCPITDSMRINSFLKANNLPGRSCQPDWYSLSELGDPEKIRQFVADNRLRQLILLEDFVGSGTQMRSAVEFSAGISDDLKILALPLVTCPAGDQVGYELAEMFANVSYAPVMVIPPEMLIKAEAQPDEPTLFQDVRDLIVRVRARLNKPEQDSESRCYHGYKGTGAVVVMYSNCPDNSLPIIYDKAQGWEPLFRRVERA